MVRREIEIDEESDRILAGLLQSHQSVEASVESCEDAHRDSLLAQKDRGERGFREGRFTTWDEVKRRNDL
jgi:hypothetical protein